MTIPPQFVLMIVLFGPGIIACYIFIKKIQQNRARLRESMEDEEPVKLPGHSVLEKIERTHEKVTDKIVFLIFPTILHACVFYMFFESRAGDEMTFIFLFGVETGIIALLGFKLCRLLRELEKYKVGYRGELFVSQILQPLSLMGYRIFHDLDLEGLKIDHLLINDSGVFCLETETPETPKTFKRKKDRELNYNGREIQYPWGNDASCIRTVQKKRLHPGKDSARTNRGGDSRIPSYHFARLENQSDRQRSRQCGKPKRIAGRIVLFSRFSHVRTFDG